IPEEAVISVDELNNYDNNKITIITTGSQGEPMAGLSRIAYGNHRKIKLERDDLFIISASPIPGNDKMISKVINQLYKKGAEVIYEDLEDVHVSGHAYQEELKLIHSITKPKYFLPVHGEYRHLKHHADLAKKMGMKGENIFTMENGDVLEISEEGAKISGKIRTGVLYVDGIGVGDVGNIVLRDRRNLARDGMVIIVFAIDMENFYLASGPDVITRGFIYARENEDIINEIKELVANGTKEVTLLGQNVDSYGKTLEEEDRMTFAELLRAVNEIDGLERIRFMTSHPKDISDEVIYAMRDCDKVCEFLHLPVQCGSTKLLKKMNRHYSKEDYLRIVEKAKAEVPNIAFSTDIMVGFPGETEEDVEDTLDVIRQVRYDNAFTFIYSKRTGTPAAKMEDQIPEDVKHKRFNRVLELVNEISKENNTTHQDEVVEILVEGKSKTDDTKFTGRTRQNKLVNFSVKNPDADLIGKLVNVKITEAALSFSLNGEMVE
ncbi:MAG: MiaB/RimO family radical SAM methylthiotransferase, partial [Intestinibacter bartlettii]|nr:MiaB/RimO family radical SAM methylthiotransferase [Intestinibacter bartlettii]